MRITPVLDGVEIDRLQVVYTTMLEGKDAIILEKNNTLQKLEEQIQNLKEQIEELREDKKFLKQALQKNKYKKMLHFYF